MRSSRRANSAGAVCSARSECGRRRPAAWSVQSVSRLESWIAAGAFGLWWIWATPAGCTLTRHALARRMNVESSAEGSLKLRIRASWKHRMGWLRYSAGGCRGARCNTPPGAFELAPPRTPPSRPRQGWKPVRAETRLAEARYAVRQPGPKASPRPSCRRAPARWPRRRSRSRRIDAVFSEIGAASVREGRADGPSLLGKRKSR